ncbi:hypothetical protein EDB89DRAFT_1134495 [Lactarius sanguifluus]|nr:hypothetical protein EDB89DRAFT_1134495 [Lactarius sanguifluus]
MFICIGPFSYFPSFLPQTHYLHEVPRQARVTHLVRCFSRSPLRMRRSFFGIYGGGNGVAFVVGLPSGLAFRPLRPWLRALLSTPPHAAHRACFQWPLEGCLEDSFGECAPCLLHASQSPSGSFLPLHFQVTFYYLCVRGELYRVSRPCAVTDKMLPLQLCSFGHGHLGLFLST